MFKRDLRSLILILLAHIQLMIFMSFPITYYFEETLIVSNDFAGVAPKDNYAETDKISYFSSDKKV